MPFDLSTAVEIAYPATPACRPGERVVAGRIYTFDQDALNLHLAREREAAAPEDLSELGDDELASLYFAALRIDAATGGRDRDLLDRTFAERQCRAGKAVA